MKKDENTLKIKEKTKFRTVYIDNAEEIATTMLKAGYFVKIDRLIPEGTVPDFEVIIYELK